MDLTGSGFSAVFSSSCMPFLKALMPCATSPIRSEILPRPNSSRTTAITTIQCQMLSEPILQPSKLIAPGQTFASSGDEWPRPAQTAAARPNPALKLGAAAIKNKDRGWVKSRLTARIGATVNRCDDQSSPLPPSASGPDEASGLGSKEATGSAATSGSSEISGSIEASG